MRGACRFLRALEGHIVGDIDQLLGTVQKWLLGKVGLGQLFGDEFVFLPCGIKSLLSPSPVISSTPSSGRTLRRVGPVLLTDPRDRRVVLYSSFSLTLNN